MTNNLHFPSWDENTLAEEKTKQTNKPAPKVSAAVQADCRRIQLWSSAADECVCQRGPFFPAVVLFYISVFWSWTIEEQMAWCHQDHFKNENGPSTEWISDPTQPKTMPMNLTLSVTHHLLCQTTTPDPKNTTSPHPPASHLVIC